MVFNEHESIGSDAKFTIAQVADLIRSKRVFTGSVVHQDEIVAGGLVFDEIYFHNVCAIRLILLLFAIPGRLHYWDPAPEL